MMRQQSSTAATTDAEAPDDVAPASVDAPQVAAAERARETQPLAAIDRARETRPLSAMDLSSPAEDTLAAPADAVETVATMEAAASAHEEPAKYEEPQAARVDMSVEGDATVVRASVHIDPDTTIVRPAVEVRRRRNTLAAAFTPPSRTRGQDVTPPPPLPSAHDLPSGIADEVEEELDEWAVADQPTVYLVPQSTSRPSPRPQFLETDESEAWPARPTPPPFTKPRTPPRGVGTQAGVEEPQPRPPIGSRPNSPLANQPRLATPTGTLMPGTPPLGVPRSAFPDPRMSRFQRLREQRLAHEVGGRAPHEPPSVASAVRQWWSDLLPNLEHALTYQREARASGVHPVPAHEPASTSRLGDAFGRLAATARDLTERAQAVASPTLKKLHTQAEQAAQALVDKIEGPAARQQAPLLGPGRLAVFFRPGVTVGQAQALLAASRARPIRLIPRKHGFLALVTPGMEAEIGERLRPHPYVRDVVYLEYDEYGEPLEPR